MTKPIIGMEDAIPYRNEIIADEPEGWNWLCEFSVDFLTSALNRARWFRCEETAKEIAFEVTKRVFFRFKRSPEEFTRFQRVKDLTWYLLKAAKITVKSNAILEETAHKKYPVTDEEAEEIGIDLNRRPRVFGFGFPDAERASIAREFLAVVETASARLSPKRRNVLSASSRGLSHEEIAQEVGIKSVKSVGQELKRARRDMAKFLPKDHVPGLEAFLGRQPGTLCA